MLGDQMAFELGPQLLPGVAVIDGAARRLDLRVLLTPGGWRRDLERVAARFEELPASAGASRRTS